MEIRLVKDAQGFRDTITAATARTLLGEASRDGMSRVNKGLSKEQALGIFQRAIAPLPDEAPVWCMTARNILREIGRSDLAGQLG